MKVLVTGSSGMLGQALCSKLADQHEVVGLDVRQKSEVRNQKSDFYQVDLTDRDSTLNKIKEIRPDITIHCAAYTDVDGCELDHDKAYKQNIDATEAIIMACKKTASFLIYISTDFVFDGEKNLPYVEDDIPNPINIYGKSKSKAEVAIRESIGSHLIIRTSWLFGAGGRNFIEKVLDKTKSEKQIKVVDDQFGSPTYAVDVAVAINNLITNHQMLNVKHKILHISNFGSCSWYEFAKEIIRLKGLNDIEVLPMPSSELDRPARRPKNSVLNNSNFNNLCKMQLPDWKDALRRYLNEATTYGAK